jgi:hypothetical protein
MILEGFLARSTSDAITLSSPKDAIAFLHFVSAALATFICHSDTAMKRAIDDLSDR